MISYISLGLCVLNFAKGCSVTELTTNQFEGQNNEDRILKIYGINVHNRGHITNKQEAIRIVREDVVRTFGDKVDIDQFVILACEQAKVWRIIFDYKLEPGQDIQDLPHSSFPKYVRSYAVGMSE